MPVEYSTVSQLHRAEALAMLVSREAASEQAGCMATVTAAIRQGDPAAQTLVSARRHEKLTGAAWGQILPGKTALLWPVRLATNEHEVVGDRLQEFLDARLEAAGIRLAQAVFPDRHHVDSSRLERVGYTHAADLLYLVSSLEQVNPTSGEAEVRFIQYTPRERKRLSDLVERTYVNTLDVPALDGVRDIRDVLDGYEQTGEFSPERWFVIQHAGEDVGCLLLNDHPLQQQWELVYMGIVPEARGNGWGSLATRYAQRLAKDAGRERVILAVDAANDPAVSAYTKAGFYTLLRRSVFLKFFGA